MTHEELLQKEVIKIKDIMECSGLSYNTASRIIRQVKAKGDRLGISGMVHRQDYIDYLNSAHKVEK